MTFIDWRMPMVAGSNAREDGDPLTGAAALAAMCQQVFDLSQMHPNAPRPSRTEARIRQVAALPYRLADDGNVEIMLITSRGGNRWIPPKGNLMPGFEPYEAAAQEAYEEAGIIGEIFSDPLGDYRAVTAVANGSPHDVVVTLYALWVRRRVADWPEKGQRSVLWFERRDAVRAVTEPDLARLIRRFVPLRRPAFARDD